MKRFTQEKDIGKGVKPRDLRAVVRILPQPDKSVQAMLLADKGKEFGRLTGLGLTDGKNTYWQVTLYASLKKAPNGKWKHAPGDVEATKTGWIYANFVTQPPVVTFKDGELDGEQVVQVMVANDNRTSIYLNELNSLIQLSKSKGVDTSSFEAAHDRIAKRVTQRRKKLESQGIKTAQDEPSYWNKFMNHFGLGFVPLIVLGVVLIIGVIVGGISIYWIFWPDYEDSKYDIKESAEVVAALKKLQPEEAKLVEDFYEKEASKAYQDGKSSGSWDSYLSMGKNLLIGGAFIYGFTKLMPMMGPKQRA